MTCRAFPLALQIFPLLESQDLRDFRLLRPDSPANVMDQSLVAAGFLLILAGFVIGLVSLLRSQGSHAGSRGEKRRGTVIIIGPIPIIFGSDPGIARMF